MPRSMLRRLPIVACALALAAPLGLVACGGEKEQGIDVPAREGLAVEMGGIDYTVFITRELNPRITPDKAYVKVEAPPGQSLYGIFLKAATSRRTSARRPATSRSRDNQDNSSSPSRCRSTTRSPTCRETLDPEECIPEAGSVAQLGPTAGSMLLFKFPLENTENRPLELEIEQGGEKRTFELDI